MLLVVIVPKLIPARYTPTTLGMHKNVRPQNHPLPPILTSNPAQLENTITTILQTFSGLLDSADTSAQGAPTSPDKFASQKEGIQQLLHFFLAMNAVLWLAVLGLWVFDWARKRPRPIRLRRASSYVVLGDGGGEEVEEMEMARAEWSAKGALGVD